ncbi:hypothetical protein [Streptomyces sp. G-G2]|uniref:hypothetical protein n=1 Tax=Streptomyces sp. G-G2 TaxID=3046201 RepID=UPI0024B90B62|nr:hypothetical protein [Streptomyces sp. G-G2]MDJ0381325.1 hypothetical protein [Streptomyces sp. G-G2]
MASRRNQRSRALGTRTALTCSALFLAAACGVPEVDISTDALAGNWSSSGGASVQFEPDGTFTASGLDRTDITSHCTQLGESARGTWAFADDSSSTSEVRADHGWHADATFEGVPCALDVVVYGDPASPVVCFTMDVFSECDVQDHFRHAPE